MNRRDLIRYGVRALAGISGAALGVNAIEPKTCSVAIDWQEPPVQAVRMLLYSNPPPEFQQVVIKAVTEDHRANGPIREAVLSAAKQ